MMWVIKIQQFAQKHERQEAKSKSKVEIKLAKLFKKEEELRRKLSVEEETSSEDSSSN